jgi:uncharacterized protein YdeI (YjbR/CyaY-like superfamily)
MDTQQRSDARSDLRPRVDVASVLGLTIPVELGVLLDESAAARARFWRLDDAQRLCAVRHIEEARTPEARGHRAMTLAAGLLGAPVDVRQSLRSWQI